jgi:hypothetical protein
MPLNTLYYNSFSSSFITANSSDFDEFIRLSTIASEKIIDGKNPSVEEDKLYRMILLMEAIDYTGITDKEEESIRYCLTSIRTKVPTLQENLFSSSFLTANYTYFTEFIRLGTAASQKIVEGKDPADEEDKMYRMLMLLEASDYTGITEKEEEALAYCLSSFVTKVPTLSETLFSTAFLTLYYTSFTEFLRLMTESSERMINGKESKSRVATANKFYTILTALKTTGLTDKEIEALRYCLLNLNPNISDISEVTEEPTVEAESYTLIANAGLFSLSGQDIEMSMANTLVADHGSFALSGQDVELSASNTLEVDHGSFALTGQDATFTYTPAEYFLEMELAEAISGSPQWRAVFEIISPADSDTLNVTGNGATDTGTLHAESDVVCRVYKVSNSGIAEDAGEVEFFLNAVSEGAPDTFIATDNLDGTGANYKTHTFTGLSPDDVLKVLVTEG